MSGKKSTNMNPKQKAQEPKKVNLFSLLEKDSGSSDSEEETRVETKTEIIKDDSQINAAVQVSENETTLLNTNAKMSDFVPAQQKHKKEKNNHNHNNNSMKYDDKVLEYKQIYDETKTYENIGNELKLNSYWTVWVHKADNIDWTLQSYQKRYVINSLGSFWRFFNNFQFYDCYKNQLFIMRGEIAPIWEDVNNKFGGICSIKVDSTQRGFKTDISTEVFISICMLIMNETFIMNNEDINGISYTVKKRGILIKLWTKTYHKDDKFIDDLPKPLFNKFNNELQKQLNGILGENYKMSIQYKQIKPEFDIN
jgi:hypothetical protein